MENDLINRQAAIEEIQHAFDRETLLNSFVRKVAVDALKTTPSAQPKIIRCKDCQHANECHKSVQFTRNEPNTVTIGYSPIEWCSRGERREE